MNYAPEKGMVLTKPKPFVLEKVETLVLPDPEGEVKLYFFGVTEECPKEYETMSTDHGVITFSKYVLPTTHSLKSRAGRKLNSGLPTVYLSENQAKAIREHAKKKYIKVGERYDWKTSEESGLPTKKPAIEGHLSDWLILIEASQYNPFKEHIPSEPEVTEEEDFKSKLYEAQGTKKGKSKK